MIDRSAVQAIVWSRGGVIRSGTNIVRAHSWALTPYVRRHPHPVADRTGDPPAAEQLLPLVYDELRKLAAAKLAQEKPGQTLQATALVHEAYIRLVDVEKAQHWNSRGHFFAAAAEAMRRILVDQARRKQATKRGGQGRVSPLTHADVGLSSPADEILTFDEALTRLTAEDSRKASRLFKLRYFAGLIDRQTPPSWSVSRVQLPTHTGLTLGPGLRDTTGTLIDQLGD